MQQGAKRKTLQNVQTPILSVYKKVSDFENSYLFSFSRGKPPETLPNEIFCFLGFSYEKLTVKLTWMILCNVCKDKILISARFFFWDHHKHCRTIGYTNILREHMILTVSRVTT